MMKFWGFRRTDSNRAKKSPAGFVTATMEKMFDYLIDTDVFSQIFKLDFIQFLKAILPDYINAANS